MNSFRFFFTVQDAGDLEANSYDDLRQEFHKRAADGFGVRGDRLFKFGDQVSNLFTSLADLYPPEKINPKEIPLEEFLNIILRKLFVNLHRTDFPNQFFNAPNFDLEKAKVALMSIIIHDKKVVGAPEEIILFAFHLLLHPDAGTNITRFVRYQESLALAFVVAMTQGEIEHYEEELEKKKKEERSQFSLTMGPLQPHATPEPAPIAETTRLENVFKHLHKYTKLLNHVVPEMLGQLFLHAEDS